MYLNIGKTNQSKNDAVSESYFEIRLHCKATTVRFPVRLTACWFHGREDFWEFCIAQETLICYVGGFL